MEVENSSKARPEEMLSEDEKKSQAINQQNEAETIIEPGSPDFSFIRHGEAKYNSNQTVLHSDNPEQPFNPKSQESHDLTEKGIELARESAERFFLQFDAGRDALFFASSDNTRAIETANIYRKVAKAKGFEVIRPEHTRSGIPDEVSEGEVRVVEALSLSFENTLAQYVFSPSSQVPDVNWGAMSDESKKRWAQARSVVEADDQGSWAANYLRFSQEIQDVFPEIKSAADLYDTQFHQIIRLVEFAQRKIAGEEYPKQIKVLGFGHENYMLQALKKYLDEQKIGNCEALQISVDEGNVHISKITN